MEQTLYCVRGVWRPLVSIQNTDTILDIYCLYAKYYMYTKRLYRNNVLDLSLYINALVNVNSQGILTFEKMCCQSPLYGSKVPRHKCISALGCIDFFFWGCIDFYVKMLLDGCSIPKNAP